MARNYIFQLQMLPSTNFLISQTSKNLLLPLPQQSTLKTNLLKVSARISKNGFLLNQKSSIDRAKSFWWPETSFHNPNDTWNRKVSIWFLWSHMKPSQLDIFWYPREPYKSRMSIEKLSRIFEKHFGVNFLWGLFMNYGNLQFKCEMKIMSQTP